MSESPSFPGNQSRARVLRVELRLVLVIAGIVAVITAPLLVFGDVIDEHFTGGKGLAFLRDYGAWASVAAVALIVSDIVLPVPAPAIMAALGMLYGPLLGGAIGGAGSVLAGLFAYWSCRLTGKRAAVALLGQKNLARLSRFFDRVGLVAIALSRWMPLLPEALACLAGLSRMPAGRFTIALSIGSLAMGFSFAALGAAYADSPLLGLMLSALVPLAAWPVLRFWLKRKERSVAL